MKKLIQYKDFYSIKRPIYGFLINIALLKIRKKSFQMKLLYILLSWIFVSVVGCESDNSGKVFSCTYL